MLRISAGQIATAANCDHLTRAGYTAIGLESCDLTDNDAVEEPGATIDERMIQPGFPMAAQPPAIQSTGADWTLWRIANRSHTRRESLAG